MKKNNYINSLEQLILDFGKNPPIKLLENKDLTSFNFRIYKIGSLGLALLAFHHIVNYFILFFSNSKKDVHPDDEELMHIIAKSKNILFGSSNPIRLKLRSLKEMPLIKRVVNTAYSYGVLLFVLIFCLFLSPLLILSLIFYFFYNFYKQMSPALGFYITSKVGKGKVLVFDKKIKKLKNVTFDSVVTHEHIHFLQHEISNKQLGIIDFYEYQKVMSEFIKYDHPKESIHERYNIKDLLYFLSAKETEARLHELVISFYKKTSTVPGSYNEFIKMLFSFSGIFTFINENDKRINEILGKEFQVIDDLEIRSQVFFQQLRINFFVMAEVGLFGIYSLKVMPAFYANLLGIYFGNDERIKFLKTCPRLSEYEAFYPLT